MVILEDLVFVFFVFCFREKRKCLFKERNKFVMYEIENKNLDFVIKELRRENFVCSEFK